MSGLDDDARARFAAFLDGFLPADYAQRAHQEPEHERHRQRKLGQKHQRIDQRQERNKDVRCDPLVNVEGSVA